MPGTGEVFDLRPGELVEGVKKRAKCLARGRCSTSDQGNWWRVSARVTHPLHPLRRRRLRSQH